MVQSLVKKGLSAFVSKQTNIISAAFFIIITTILSQVLGLLKYRLLVSVFGASNDLGVFFASFRIPDLIFQVIIAGALSTSFIPIFSEYIGKNKKSEAYAFTSSLITIGFATFIIVSAFIMLFSYQFAYLSAPGFSVQERAQMATLMKIIQISQIFFILGTIITAILQSFQHFLIAGIATSFYNLGIIIGIIVLTPFLGIYGAAYGALLGSILFFLVQLPGLKHTGFKYYLSFDMKNGVGKILKLMLPRSLTIIVSQLALMASLFFASFTSSRSYGIFELALTLVMAPVLLFGQSIAQASFPALSMKHENKEEFTTIFMSSFNQILYLTLPISAILIVLRIPVVRLAYGASRFDWAATVETGFTLALFSLSLFAQALIYLFSRGFFAFKDTKTPLFITLFSVIFYITFSYFAIIINKLPISYLAFGYSVSNIISIILLIIYINKKVSLPKIEMIISMTKIGLAALIMGVALYIPIKLLDQLVFDSTRTINLLVLTGIASFVGLTAYIFFTWLLDIKEASYIIDVLKQFGNRKKMLKQIGEIINGPNLNA